MSTIYQLAIKNSIRIQVILNTGKFKRSCMTKTENAKCIEDGGVPCQEVLLGWYYFSHADSFYQHAQI